MVAGQDIGTDGNRIRDRVLGKLELDLHEEQIVVSMIHGIPNYNFQWMNGPA